MRKISLVLLSIGMLLALSFAWQGRANADGDDDDGDRRGGFGQKIAGSYLVSFQTPPGSAPSAGQLTFNADGTLTGFPEAAFGRNNPPASRFRSAWHGVWERTGRSTLKWRFFILAHDAGTGDTFWVCRNNAVAEFDEDFETFTSDMLNGIFSPGQILDPPNPNTDEPPDYGVFPGIMEGTRIHVAGADDADDDDDDDDDD